MAARRYEIYLRVLKNILHYLLYKIFTIHNVLAIFRRFRPLSEDFRRFCAARRTFPNIAEDCR